MLSERWRDVYSERSSVLPDRAVSDPYYSIIAYTVGVRGCASHLTESEYGAVHLVPKGVSVEHNICHQTQSPIRAGAIKHHGR